MLGTVIWNIHHDPNRRAILQLSSASSQVQLVSCEEVLESDLGAGGGRLLGVGDLNVEVRFRVAAVEVFVPKVGVIMEVGTLQGGYELGAVDGEESGLARSTPTKTL